ncbi:hypothetical protein BD289DRAFT_425176 [Coniella lustricola]|uniref:Zn(2)-C6 fungal-type domain-containing protein n=1 Tax=Coniella lustricola TaxID=2025994 RepID=A0A2T3AHM4_9PEZI|nr:hypothetical protein BD289DRAFT_425176 [Coniella lustricola]
MHVVVPEVKACVSCAKSKRKCGKERPRCHRCETRDLECQYPPPRPSSFVPLGDGFGSAWERQVEADSALEYGHLRGTAANITASVDIDINNPRSPEVEQPLANPAATTKTLDLWDPTSLLGPLPDFSLLLAPPCSHPDSTSTKLQLQPHNHRPQTVASQSPSCPSSSLPFIPQLSTCDWFLGPETWEFPDSDRCHDSRSLDPSSSAQPPSLMQPMTMIPPYARTILKPYLRSLQSDLADWISKGGTTFIHKQLYAFELPRCIQDAQGALALYLARCPATEDAVFRILDERARQLLVDEAKHNTSSSLDSSGHLARVQALLTYQIIGLLDGDIYLRAAAEERAKVLVTWVSLMLDSVQFAAAFCKSSGSEGGGGQADGRRGNINGKVAESTCGHLRAIVGLLGLGIKDLFSPEQTAAFPAQAQEELVWRAWIFTESLRRTSIVAEALPAVYHALKAGWAMCPKGMRVTVTEGMWDAESRYAWTQTALGLGNGKRKGQKGSAAVWFLDGRDTEILLRLARPEDVDAFTTLCMEVCFGIERIEKWKTEKGQMS